MLPGWQNNPRTSRQNSRSILKFCHFNLRPRDLLLSINHAPLPYRSASGIVQCFPRQPLELMWVQQRDELERLRELIRPNVLDVGDLATTQSRARLVTLSACETGLIRTDEADDPVGLVPTLLEIGVRGVVATLWKVDAETTTRTMSDFYEALRSPGGWDQIPQCLRRATAKIRSLYPHPHFWAPFVVVGGIGRSAQE